MERWANKIVSTYQTENERYIAANNILLVKEGDQRSILTRDGDAYGHSVPPVAHKIRAVSASLTFEQ